MVSRGADATHQAHPIVLIPLVGPLHLMYPAYNTVTVRAAVEAAGPAAIATTALEPGAFEDPLWQDTPELALPQTVVPWARRHGVPVEPIGAPSPDPAAASDFARYASTYPALRQAWQRAQALEAPLADLLAKPLGLERIVNEALPLLAAAQSAREEAFGDGPATDWLRQRTALMADRLIELAAEAHGPVAAPIPLDHVPLVQEALTGRAAFTFAAAPAPSEDARIRSLLDYAMRVDVAEPQEVIRSLRELDGPEARYHEANLLLAHDHVPEALELLEGASRGDFSQPYWLPGYLLARLGQVYDLSGRRDAAVRAYRGVRALSWAPPEAREAARAGIERPFAPEAEPGR